MEKKSGGRRGLLIGCGIALAVVCLIGIVGLLLGLPVWQDTQAGIACAMQRSNEGAEDPTADCAEWQTVVKKEHASEYNTCVTRYGINNDDRELLMGCFLDQGIDPATILGR